MTYEELKQSLLLREQQTEAAHQQPRRKVHDYEHQLQAQCFRWFNCQYPGLYSLLFAIPNGGQRNIKVARKLSAEGVVPGVADLFLSVAAHGYHGAYIEMKTTNRGSRQSDAQKAFEQAVTRQGYRYIIIRTLDEFITFVKDYLS